MWVTEKQFCNYIMSKLKSVGFQPIRVESASTISGMPDLYVLGNRDDYFIELKNMKNKSIKDGEWKIPWRPGQQAWAQQYNMHMFNYFPDCAKNKFSWTFVGLKDGALLIRMENYISTAMVFSNEHVNSHFVFVFNKDELRKLDLALFLTTHSYMCVPMIHKDDTWYTYINRCMVYMLRYIFHVSEDEVDYPTPEMYFDNIGIPGHYFDAQDADEPIYKNKFNLHTIGWLTRCIAEQALITYTSYKNNELNKM